MPDSVHTARWINQFSDQGWDVHLFPVYDAAPHGLLRNITFHSFASSRPPGLDRSVRVRGVYPLRRGAGRAGRYLTRLFPARMVRAGRLASLVRRLKPDVVHSLEMQRAAYLTLEAKATLGDDFPPWLVSAWGSDIYLFGRLSEHAERVKAVLSACDYFTADCERDIRAVRKLGFAGGQFPALPVGGGFDIERAKKLRQPGRSSARRLITLKGYQNWAGRALNGLRAIELCADVLKDYRVAIYLAGEEVALAAELVSQSTSISVEVIPKCEHDKMLQLHGRARISIGISISDGLPSSAMEAAVMGAFPVQSNTSCVDEWLRHGETGLFVHPEDPEEIAAAIRRAVTDDEMVDRAAGINFRLISERLSHSVIQRQVIAMYREIAESSFAANSDARL